MPELPEVETVRCGLLPTLGGRITKVWGSGLPLHGNRKVDLSRLQSITKGATIHQILRRGKYLVIELKRNKAVLSAKIVVHLGMSGRLRLLAAAHPQAPHTHVILRLAHVNPPSEIRYSDPRRFGQFFVHDPDIDRHPGFDTLGIDPLNDTFTGTMLYRECQRSRRAIKLVLLDQRVVAGVGNIYASEALHHAGIHPELPANRLSPPRANVLAASIVAVLHRALEDGGTSLKDFVHADGKKGGHSDYLLVYGREGQTCSRKGCTGKIRRHVQGGRATFLCSRCQKLGTV